MRVTKIILITKYIFIVPNSFKVYTIGETRRIEEMDDECMYEKYQLLPRCIIIKAISVPYSNVLNAYR